MNWLQESLMMSSQVAPGVPPTSTPTANILFPTSSPSSSHSSPAHYEGRIGMIPGPTYPSPFTANLNFNLIKDSYKQDKAEASSESFEGNLSPSSGTGSPRTDETLDKTSDPVEAEPEPPVSGLEMLRQQAQTLAKPGGLAIRQELQTQSAKQEDEINDVEENEELQIDEEMEEADSSRDKHEETFEEVPADKVDSKQFSNFQPYLNMKDSAENGGINSLEKLQQVRPSLYRYSSVGALQIWLLSNAINYH